MHPGSYDGAVSVTVLVPSARAGMSLMANSDSAMEGLQLELMKAFIGLATGQPGEIERLRKAMEAYPRESGGKGGQATRGDRGSPCRSAMGRMDLATGCSRVARMRWAIHQQRCTERCG